MTTAKDGVDVPVPPSKQVRLVEGQPREIGQAQDRYGEHLDRPPGVRGTFNDQPENGK